MDDLLQYIDLDYYRSAQLLIAHAEIAQLRGQSSAAARTAPQCNIPAATSHLVDALDEPADGDGYLRGQ